MPSEIPQAVLSEQLAEVIAGRKVRAAVFTTFTFDPGFFELHVLPALFDIPISQVDKVRRIQLDDALRTVEDVAVYYDRTALSQDAMPAQLDFRRLGVRVPTGIFHPKLLLVLVENEGEDDETPGYESLIVGTLSANLTRAGWWENVEVGHFEQIEDKDSVDVSHNGYAFRTDLVDLTRRLKELGGPKEEQEALERIRVFLLKRTPTHAPLQNSAVGVHYTRLFHGQSDLPDWIAETMGRWRDWNLEIISPYFDGENAGTLERLIEEIQPRQTRVYLPFDLDGKPTVSAELFAAIAKVATWGKPPQSLIRPGARTADTKAAPRFVHAKIYRFWRNDGKDGKQVVLVGSPNLTNPAHSDSKSGNLEAAFLVDVSKAKIPRRWWLTPLEDEPAEFADEDLSEDGELDNVFVDISLRFDWQAKQLSYRFEGENVAEVSICDPIGRPLFNVAKSSTQRWHQCSASQSQMVRELLPSTSFLQIVHPKGTWRVLVREENMVHRPSLLSSLTSEEILMYWSLLSDAQKEAFIVEKMAGEGELEGLENRTNRYNTKDTVFDRFAGVYHAFEQLYTHVTDCVARGDLRDAEARMFGAKYDSLPELLDKTLNADSDADGDRDAVMQYIIFLCAKQIRTRVKRQCTKFWKQDPKGRRRLEFLLTRLPDLARALPLDDGDREEFLEWYESMFVRMVNHPEEPS